MEDQAGLGPDTRLWTHVGLRPVRDLAAAPHNVLLHGPGGTVFVEARATSLGVQPTVAVTIGRKTTKTVITAPTQTWRVKTRATEDRMDSKVVRGRDLVAGQRLVTVRPRSRLAKVTPSPFGVAAGIVFGDGCRPAGREASDVTLHGPKRQLVEYFRGCPTSVNSDGSISITGLPGSFKAPIALTEGTSALYGWLAGYIATDGSVTRPRGQVTLSSARWEHLDWARTVATRIGIGAGDISTYARIGLGQTELTEIFSVRLQRPPLGLLLRDDHRQKWSAPVGTIPSWTVRAVEPVRPVEQWSLRTSGVGSLVLDGYVLVAADTPLAELDGAA